MTEKNQIPRKAEEQKDDFREKLEQMRNGVVKTSEGLRTQMEDQAKRLRDSLKGD
jgi:hypothetical protein